LRGLVSFGPFSKGLVADPIRVATIVPKGEGEKLYGFMRELSASHTPRERREYLPRWPGFSTVFGVKMRGASKDCHLELDGGLEEQIERAEGPQIVLAEAITRAIQRLELQRSEFEVVFIYLPTRWQHCF